MGLITIDHLILWGICLSCFILIVRILYQSPLKNWGWLGVGFVILFVTLGFALWWPSWAAQVGTLLWFLLIGCPRIGFYWTRQLIEQQHYPLAYTWAKWIRLLHPADGWWEQPQLIRALQLVKQGDLTGATTILSQYRHLNSAIARYAQSLFFYLQGNWGEYVQWIQQEVTPEQLQREPTLVSYYVQALGEIGQLELCLQALHRYELKGAKSGDRAMLNLMRMFACVFCGEVALVQQLFATSLSQYNSEIQRYWLATAYAAAGEKRLAREQFQQLQFIAPKQFQAAIAHRLKSPPKVASKILSPYGQSLVDNLREKIYQENIERKYQSLILKPSHTNIITHIFITLNSLFFALEIWRGGATNLEVVYRLGAFIPMNVWAGEWWRLITASFLHLGWFHFLSNMITLYLLGPFVEQNLGKKNYAIVYLLTGIGTLSGILLLVFWGQQQAFETIPTWLNSFVDEIKTPERMWLGASGSIMGIVGAIAVILLKGWRQEKSQLAAYQLRIMGAVVLLQLTTDFMNPQISFLSHFIGIILGMMLTILLIGLNQWRSRHRATL